MVLYSLCVVSLKTVSFEPTITFYLDYLGTDASLDALGETLGDCFGVCLGERRD